MATTGVEVKGLAELQRALERLVRDTSKKIVRRALKVGAEPVRKEQVDKAPYDSGFLSRHFGVKVHVSGREISGSAFIGPQGKINYPRRNDGKTITTASVARFFEFGTSKMPAKPWMRAALVNNVNKIIELMSGAIRSAVEEDVK